MGKSVISMPVSPSQPLSMAVIGNGFYTVAGSSLIIYNEGYKGTLSLVSVGGVRPNC